MATHNQEGRRRTPERIPVLNQYGVEQFYAAHQRNELGTQLLLNSCHQQYPERVQQTGAAQYYPAEVLNYVANQQATQALGNMAGQGAVAQTPGQWSPRQEVRYDAPQGPFDQEFIQQEAGSPEPGFGDLYGRQIPMSEEAITGEINQGGDAMEEFLRQQAGDRQLEDV